MVKTIKEHNILNNTCVIMCYNNKYSFIALWNYDNRKETEFYSPCATFPRYTDYHNGLFRLNDNCSFVRHATTEEIKTFQNILNKNNINFKIPKQNIYELW